jgi:hypothetical protein
VKKNLFFNLLLVFGVFSCADSETEKDLTPFMVDVTQFKIDTSILKDGEKVEILGSSGNLTEKHKIDFYNLVVVRSLESGDTVNVLLTNFFQATSNPETVFMSNSSIMGKAFENSDELQEGVDINKIPSKKFSKVFYDTEFIEVDVRKYPAIPGNLGDFTIEGEL